MIQKAPRFGGAETKANVQAQIERCKRGEPTPNQSSDGWLIKSADLRKEWALQHLAQNAIEQQDWQAAHKWLELAMETESPQGILKLAELHWHGFGVKRDKEKALDLFYQAEELGAENATFWVAYAHCGLRRKPDDLVKGYNSFSKLEGSNNQIADAFLELLKYPNWRNSYPDLTPPKIYSTAVNWRRVQTSGSVYCPNYDIYLQRTHQPDFGRVLANLVFAAEAGYLPAAEDLHKLYRDGGGGILPDPYWAEVWRLQVEQLKKDS